MKDSLLKKSLRKILTKKKGYEKFLTKKSYEKFQILFEGGGILSINYPDVQLNAFLLESKFDQIGTEIFYTGILANENSKCSPAEPTYMCVYMDIAWQCI